MRYEIFPSLHNLSIHAGDIIRRYGDEYIVLHIVHAFVDLSLTCILRMSFSRFLQNHYLFYEKFGCVS
jgi:hypothetical protein